jgi:hypothetical protein
MAGVRCWVLVPLAALYGPKVQDSDKRVRLWNAEGWTLRREFLSRLTIDPFSPHLRESTRAITQNDYGCGAANDVGGRSDTETLVAEV